MASQEKRPKSICVRHGVLPLKLNSGADGRELDRAKLLLASLRHFWKGTDPFHMHIVGETNEAEEIGESLAASVGPRLTITVHAEDEFFSEGSPFFATKGMYKQQLIKLWVPWKLGLAAFITFDADVVCIRDFDERTFVRDNKLISKWEPRKIHSWWANSMVALRVWGDQDEPGLGVTPNVLHARICRQVFRYLELQGFDPINRLCELTTAHPKLTTIEGEGIPLTWSEYSLYTLVGEWFRDLERLHASSLSAAELGMRMQSRRSVWYKSEIDRLKPDPDDPGYFLVVQSWSGIPPEEVQARLGLHLLPVDDVT
jgi:hypothetical protein